MARQYDKFVARLILQGNMSVQDTVSYLGVSESTARRFFSKLEKEGKAIRYYGGIRYLQQNIAQYDFQTDKSRNYDEKIAIARQAVRYVEDGDTIFCDSGSTVLCFCLELAKVIEAQKIHVNIFTNSQKNLEVLFPVTEVSLLGGRYRHKREDFCGFLTNEGLEELFFHKCFVGSDACVEGKYFTTTDEETMKINQLAVRHSGKAFVLLDSSKFLRNSNILFASAAELYCVITDSHIRKDIRATLEKEAANMICAEVPV